MSNYEDALQSMKDDARDQAQEYIERLRRDAERFPVDVDVEPLVEKLQLVVDGAFKEVQEQDVEIREAIARVTEPARDQFRSMNVQPRGTSLIDNDSKLGALLDTVDQVVTMQENDTKLMPFDEFYEYVNERLRERLGEDAELRVTHSCSDYFDDYREDNLDEVAIEGLVKFKHSNDYGDGVFESDIIESPTYLDALVEANKMMLQFDYRDHTFLEALHVKDEHGNDLKFVDFRLGS